MGEKGYGNLERTMGQAVFIYHGVYSARFVDQAVIIREDWQRLTKLIMVFQISFRDDLKNN